MNDEARKKLIYLVAGMLLCRKLAALEGRPSPARETAFRDAIETVRQVEVGMVEFVTVDLRVHWCNDDEQRGRRLARQTATLRTFAPDTFFRCNSLLQK